MAFGVGVTGDTRGNDTPTSNAIELSSPVALEVGLSMAS
jgi:hypothetical protein